MGCVGQGAATNILEALVKETTSLTKSDVLTEDEENMLIMKANEIISAIQPS
jgi:hypothetical protein